MATPNELSKLLSDMIGTISGSLEISNSLKQSKQDKITDNNKLDYSLLSGDILSSILMLDENGKIPSSVFDESTMADSSIYQPSGISLGSKNDAKYTINAGNNTIGSTSNYSLVVGTNNTLSNSRSCLIGSNLRTNFSGQTIFGKYNASVPSAIFVIGNGTGNSARLNAFSIDSNANASISGNLFVKDDLNVLSSIYVNDKIEFDELHYIDKDKIELWENKEDRGFTSFKVWASSFKINNGDVSGLTAVQKNKMIEIYGDWVTEISLYSQILTGYTEAFLLRTTVSDELQSDVYVDWGDGSISEVANGEFLYKRDTGTEYDYLMSHTYSDAGTYIVKIFGKDYFGINHGLTSGNTNGIYTEPQNIVCEVMTSKYSIAKNIINLSSMFKGSKKLLKMDASYSSGLMNFKNCSNMFESCKNLWSVVNISLPQGTNAYCTNMFSNCSNLHTISLSSPPLIADTGLKTMFQNCSALAIDLNSFISSPFITKKIDVTGLFRNCTSLLTEDLEGNPITVPAQYLWEDTSITWVNTSTAFAGCPAAILAQVPTTWGGTMQYTASEIASKGYVDEKLGDISTALSGIIGD